MRRDLDLIRDILLAWDSCETERGWREIHRQFLSRHRDSYQHNLEIMADRNLICAPQVLAQSAITQHRKLVFERLRLTWEGHDFLDAVRDDKIWAKAKAGAKSAGGFTFDILKDIAKGLIVTQIKKHTDVDLDL